MFRSPHRRRPQCFFGRFCFQKVVPSIRPHRKTTFSDACAFRGALAHQPEGQQQGNPEHHREIAELRHSRLRRARGSVDRVRARPLLLAAAQLHASPGEAAADSAQPGDKSERAEGGAEPAELILAVEGFQKVDVFF